MGFVERLRNRDAAMLGLVLGGVICREFFGWALAGYIAAPSLVAYIALEWPRLRANARILVVVCIGLGLWTTFKAGAGPVRSVGHGFSVRASPGWGRRGVARPSGPGFRRDAGAE